MKISSLLQGKKRYAAAAVAAATLGGGAFAFANSLTVTSNTLGAANQTVNSPEAACAPTFSYTTAWDSSNSRFDVATVTATAASNSADCNSDTIQGELTLSSGGPVNLATVSYAGGSASAPATASWTVGSSNIDAGLVTGVSGAVTGTK